MSLYNKYRPKGLNNIQGNKKIVSTLGNMLSNEKLSSRVFLFAGPTGCGKTTLGRIIKNRTNTSDADFSEIDSADFRGIDTVRELRKNAYYKPLNSAYRIYLLDECHKLTNDAQNALLKILEDTPPHLIFILCTTEKEKLIKAIKGRCSIFDVSPLSEKDMRTMLKRIVVKERQKIDSNIYDIIIDEAQGHPRNAIQILEQVLNTAPENQLDIAKQAEVERSKGFDLCQALIKCKGWKEIKLILNDLKETKQDAEGIRRMVLGYAQAILLKGENDKAAHIIEEFLEPFYNSGFPALVLACYSVTKN